MVEERFVTVMAKYGRVTIPRSVRDVSGVEEGDYVRLSLIEVMKKKAEGRNRRSGSILQNVK